MTSGDVRRDFIHSHSIVLHALGRVGKAIYQLPSPNLPKILGKLKNMNWSRKNAETWEGRAMIGGAMAKSNQNITLTSNEIKRVLGLKLTVDEQRAEDALQSSRNPRNQKKKTIK